MAHIILSNLNLIEQAELVSGKEYIQIYKKGIIYLGLFKRKNERLYYFEHSIILSLDGVCETSDFIPIFLNLLSAKKTKYPIYFKNFNIKSEPFLSYYIKPTYNNDIDLFISLYENDKLKGKFFKFYILK